MTRALALALLTGCVPLFQVVGSAAGRSDSDSNSTSSTQGPEGRHVAIEGKIYRVGPYWGPDCERIGADKRQVYRNEAEAVPTGGKQPNLSHDPADQIFRLVCVETILSSHTEPESNTWVMQHFRFDELFFDHTTAAMMLVQCLKAESCLGEGAPKHKVAIDNPAIEREMAEQAAKGRPVWQYYQVAMMRWYADHVDAAAVATKIATWPLPPAAQQAFLALLDKAKTRVIAVSNELQPEAKRLFIDIPAAIYSKRAAERAKYAGVLTELGVLIDRVKVERGAGTTGVSDATLDKLRKLRRAYHDACKTDCTRDVIFASITRQLFWAFVSRGDGPGAMAESKLFAHLEPTAAEEIAKKQSEAIEAAVGRVARVAHAREQGVDPDAARSTAHGSLLELGDGRYVYRGSRDGFGFDWAALVPDGHEVGQFGGKVAALDRKGANVVIRFQDIVSSWSEGTDCYETNRIDGISSDGKLIYREACAGKANHTEVQKVPPAMVPADEAAGLHGGDEIVGFARGTGDARLGRIWIVKHGTRVVRLRDIPM